jgi:hypothetical protein
MKKLIVILIGVIVLGLIAWFICGLYGDNQKFNIVLFNINTDSTNLDSYFNKISPNIDYDAEEIEFKFFSSYKTETLNIQKPIGIVNPETFKDTIQKKFFDLIKKIKAKDLNNIEANQMIESAFNLIFNPKYKDSKIFFIGAFPDCYDEKSELSAIELIKKLTKDKLVYGKITLAMKTNNEEPEQMIFEYLETNKLIESNLNEIVPKRKCLGTIDPNECKNNFDIIAFSSVSDEMTKKVRDKIKSIPLSDGICINFISSNGSSIETYTQQDLVKLETDISNFLLKAPKSDVKSSRFILQQFVNKHAKDTTGMKSTIFMLGEFPISKQQFVDIKPLTNNNINILVCLTSTKPNIDVNQVFINAFSSIGIQISKFCGE